MKIIFSHGKLGTPDSDKMTKLMLIAERMGFDYHSIDYTHTYDPEERLEILKNYLRNDHYEGEYIMVGSSMGGYVALLGAEVVDSKACFLLSPAFYIKGYAVHDYSGIHNDIYIEIVHGWKDMTVLPEMSLRFARDKHSTLHLLDTDHSMMDLLDEVGNLFEAFLKKFQVLN